MTGGLSEQERLDRPRQVPKGTSVTLSPPRATTVTSPEQPVCAKPPHKKILFFQYRIS